MQYLKALVRKNKLEICQISPTLITARITFNNNMDQHQMVEDLVQSHSSEAPSNMRGLYQKEELPADEKDIIEQIAILQKVIHFICLLFVFFCFFVFCLIWCMDLKIQKYKNKTHAQKTM